MDEVIVAVSDLSLEDTKEAVEITRRHKVTLKLVPTYYPLALNRMEWEDLNGIPILTCSSVDEQAIVTSRMKRAVDVVISALGLILIAPALSIVMAVIKITSPGPALYLQRRVGRGGREFDFYKLRTMRVDSPDAVHRDFVQGWIRPADNREPPVFKLVEDDRVTPIGRFLRKFSIDELPQLYSVLIGNMSLVGPRPPLPYEVELYSEWHRRRLAVRPGITGLWQVSGRNRLSFEEMVNLDLDYIQNWSHMLDFKLLLRTIPVVLCWWEAF
jgi:exopolysaccharide biosynthesis polyprenyl glycosylphosphotransferase